MPSECDLFFERGVVAPLSDDEIRATCEAVLRGEGVSRPCMVSVSVVGEARIREVNAEWRDVDRATDVISLECERPDDPDLGPDEPCELGDIVLAPDFIARQAAAYGTTAADEFRLLLTHGMLHLLGYDHLDEEQAEEMEGREESLLAAMPCDAPIGRVELTRHRRGIDE